MKTSWNETAAIEAYLQERQKPEDRLLFGARLLLQSDLAEKVAWQKSTYELVGHYSRKKLKEEIKAVGLKLFTAQEHQGFARKVRALF